MSEMPSIAVPATPEAVPRLPRSAPGLGEILADFVVPPLILGGVGLLALYGNFLLFHTLVELVAFVVAVMAMVVSRVSLGFTRNHFSIFVAVAFGWCALLDMLHALSFTGLELLPSGGGNLDTQLWIASRIIQGVALVAAPWWLNRAVNPTVLHLGFGGLVVLSALAIFAGHFPVALDEEQGLTDFKFFAEYLVLGLFVSALLIYWRKRQLMSRRLFACMVLAVLSLALSELAFTQYMTTFSKTIVFGHWLKLIAYWFIYQALVRQTLCEPFGMLGRAASTYDAVPDPTLIVDRAGRIRQANRAAARLLGVPAETLVGQLSHRLFHDPDVVQNNCPVCSRLLGSGNSFACELDIPSAHRVVECSVSPFIDGMEAYVQVVRDISQRRQLEWERERSDLRVHDVFTASPVPMQIYSLELGRLIAINDAHREWLGYALDEIALLEEWFSKVCVQRELIESRWELDMALAASGHAVRTAELTLRRKNGSTVIAQGTLTVSHGELILAWTDLTEVRRGERSLRESEQRFRGMIEQTISGVFVCRGGTFIYVNPRFCEIVGWRAGELLGRQMSLFSSDRKTLDAACQLLHSGAERSVSLTIPLQCRDGQMIELGLHASRITWDDGELAVIAMAQDITERKRAEEQIAHYVAQLEGAMKGTLQAVANMVEMRDPYTAGHEQRVGAIARALGAELGWSEERCETLELAGLVHDIGKIAIPAEILSKPTKLSSLEMELIRGHAQAGYDILKDIHFAAPVADIIHQHHERMDGSGYPRQLCGEDILPEARVLAVADVLESMAAHRPYRPSRGLGAALDELTSGRGALYDGEVVDAALRMVREKGYRLPA